MRDHRWKSKIVKIKAWVNVHDENPNVSVQIGRIRRDGEIRTIDRKPKTDACGFYHHRMSWERLAKAVFRITNVGGGDFSPFMCNGCIGWVFFPRPGLYVEPEDE